MALEDFALSTVSTVQSELGISGSTSDLERYINAFSEQFIQMTGREYHRVDGHTASIVSAGDTRLFVKRRPLLAINQIDVKGDTVDSADYAIEDADAGIIRLDDDFWESTAVARRRVESYVQYLELRVDIDTDAGYVTPKQVDDGTFSDRTLPYDIERAIITSAASAFRRQGQPSGIESEQVGDASISYAQPDGDASARQMTSPAFEAATSRYRDRGVHP